MSIVSPQNLAIISETNIAIQTTEQTTRSAISTPLLSAKSILDQTSDESLELSPVSTLTSLCSSFHSSSSDSVPNVSEPPEPSSTTPALHDESFWGLRRSSRVRKPVVRYLVTSKLVVESDSAITVASTALAAPRNLTLVQKLRESSDSNKSVQSATPTSPAASMILTASTTSTHPAVSVAPIARGTSEDRTALASSRPKRSSKTKVVPAVDIDDIEEPSSKRVKISANAEVADKLLQISQILHAQGMHTEMSVKPDPIGEPSVWSDGRQSLCETLPYYRAYQGGCYKSEGMVRAFMFDDSPMSRDYMDSSVIVVRGGGGMTRDDDGKMIQSKDHDENAQVRALRNNMAHQNPVAVIASDRCKTSPSKMPHMYNVFGWFKPTDIWYEKNGGKNVIRFRLEKLQAEEPSWWAPKGVTEPMKLGDLDKAVQLICPTCNAISSQIYLNGWMCLSPDCSYFWKFANGESAVEDHLQYDPRWLKKETPWIYSNEVQPIRPEPFVPADDDSATSAMSTKACRGRVCDSCGACIVRSDWHGWPCTTAGCGRYYSVVNSSGKTNIVRARVIESLGREFVAHAYDPQIRHFPIADSVGGYRIQKYIIPGTNSYMLHLSAMSAPIRETGGAHEMFESLQQDNLNLVRQVMTASFGRGDGRTNHYTTNFGMPYIFVASVDTSSFDGAPESVNNARACLHFWSKRLIGDEYQPFNELLLLGYMEKNEISYHDDGEYGLGPTISTMSLGCAAEFYLRMKAKHYYGVSKSAKYTDETPVPGCLSYEERLALHADIVPLRDDKAGLETMKTAIVKKLKLKTKANTPDVLRLRLNHGDIVIMHGEDLQKYYEHSVKPLGKESTDIKLRFALTCRYVDEGSLKVSRRPNYQVKPAGDYHPSWSKN